METQKKEKRETVGAEDLMSEITPILKDYFVANVEREEAGIKMTFLNGQTFLLNVRED